MGLDCLIPDHYPSISFSIFTAHRRQSIKQPAVDRMQYKDIKFTAPSR